MRYEIIFIPQMVRDEDLKDYPGAVTQTELDEALRAEFQMGKEEGAKLAASVTPGNRRRVTFTYDNIRRVAEPVSYLPGVQENLVEMLEIERDGEKLDPPQIKHYKQSSIYALREIKDDDTPDTWAQEALKVFYR